MTQTSACLHGQKGAPDTCNQDRFRGSLYVCAGWWQHLRSGRRTEAFRLIHRKSAQILSLIKISAECVLHWQARERGLHPVRPAATCPSGSLLWNDAMNLSSGGHWQETASLLLVVCQMVHERYMLRISSSCRYTPSCTRWWEGAVFASHGCQSLDWSTPKQVGRCLHTVVMGGLGLYQMC